MVFCALAVLVPMTAFFSTRAVVPLTILAVLVGTFDQIRRREWRFPIDAMTAILLGAVVLWALISAAWALDSFLAFRGAGKILGNVTIGILLLGLALKLRDEFQPKLLGYALTVGMVIALSALTIDPLFNQPFIGIGASCIWRSYSC